MDNTHKCRKCQEIKPFSEFDKNKREENGLDRRCKQCKRQEYLAKREYFLQKAVVYALLHKKEKAEYDKKYKPRRKPLRNKRHRERYKNEPEYKLTHNLRARLWDLLNRREKGSKSESALKLLECSIDKFKLYLENKFLPGMTWDNYGKNGWVIDHIKPCASFDLTNIKEQKECFHYTNMQPLWERDNLKKGDKIL